MSKRAYGFTIVELLIVIVVIGILAALSYVGYTSISTRAENTKTIQAVSQYVKVINAYAAQNGNYPVTVNYPCLTPGPEGEQCGKVEGDSGACLGMGPAISSDYFTKALRSIAGSELPRLSSQKVVCGDVKLTGGFFYSPDGKTAAVHYVLRGNQPCEGIGGAVSFSKGQRDDATFCTARFMSLA